MECYTGTGVGATQPERCPRIILLEVTQRVDATNHLTCIETCAPSGFVCLSKCRHHMRACVLHNELLVLCTGAFCHVTLNDISAHEHANVRPLERHRKKKHEGKM
jgi:hypothetical protein